MLFFVKNFSSKIARKSSIYKALSHFCVIITRASTLLTIPVAVPCVRLADGAAALHTVRLGCPISSLPINRLRQLSTPAHAYAPLYLPLAARSNAAAATRSGRFIPPQAALPSLPSSLHISISFYDTFGGRHAGRPYGF